MKRKLGSIWHFIETSDAVMTDASDRIREHRERQERLEYFAEQARAVLGPAPEGPPTTRTPSRPTPRT